MVLLIEDAHEGVEVFVNAKSMGIQIAPPFIYDISDAVVLGNNKIAIEVATTLERALSGEPNMMGQIIEPTSLSGITGDVKLFMK